MKALISFLSLFLIVHSTLSKDLPFKFGKVEKSDFSKEKCEFYPEAKSMVIGETASIRFSYSDISGWSYTMYETVRKHIFDITDANQGDIDILLYQPINSESKESILKIKAYSYNLVNGKIEKEKVKRKEIFETRVNDYWIKLSFAIPNIKKGTIFEYSYVKQSDFLTNLSTWNFQSDIPKAFSQLEVTVPEFFNYQVSNVGSIIPVQHESRVVSEEFTYMWEREKARQRGVKQIGSSKERGTGSIKSASKYSAYTAKNILPVIDEPFVSNKVDLPFRVTFQLISTKFPNSIVKMIASDYKTFNNNLLKSSSFGSRYLKGMNIKGMEINAASEKDKVVEAYNHIANHFIWNKSNSFTSSNAGRIAYKAGNGTVADINLTLLGVFKELGLEAYPVILSTRGHGYVHPVYPSYEDFNYVIAAVVMDGQTYYCDASSKLAFGDIPIKCRNGQGYLVNENGGNWVDLKAGANYDQLTSIKIEFTDHQMITAVEQKASGYAGLTIRNKLDNNEESDFINELKASHDGAEVSNFDAEKGKEVHISYQLKKAVDGENIYYLQPLTTGTLKESPFKRDTRGAPIDFPYAQSYRVYSKITVPEGYSAALPEPVILNTPNKEATFLYNLNQNGNVIDVMSTVKINKTLFGAEEYVYLKAFYEKVAAKNTEFIVLTKN